MKYTATLYTKSSCPYCVAAKQLLDEKGIPCTEIDALKHADKRDALAEKHGHYTVPMIFLNDEFVGGFTQLQALDEAGKL